MLEAYGNIWDHVNEYDAVVITTNGFVKKNGEAVMGRGIALEAKNRFPKLPARLGKHLQENGNFVGLFQCDNNILISYPVKPEYGNNGIPGWRAKAELFLIQRSAFELKRAAETFNYEKVLMPRPGCGNGGLKWEDVKPLIRTCFR